MAERKLHTTYRQDMALFPTRVAKFWLVALLAAMLLFPVFVRNLPEVLIHNVGGRDFWLSVGISTLIAAVGALGLNLLSGFAGQVSLGHAFFLAIGIFTGAVVAGTSTATLSGASFWGLDLPWWVAVIAGGAVAAVIGVLVGPVAVRLRGLYLALVTLALVFVGQWLFTSPAFDNISGGVGGRTVPAVSMVLPGQDTAFFDLTRNEQLYLAALLLAIVSFFFGKNLARSRVGRAFQATRDRDIAAEVIGVNVTWAKLVAFGVSSFYAGAAGVLFGIFLGHPIPGNFSGAEGLIVSVEFIAMIVIGGIGTVLGAALGAMFVRTLPEVVSVLSRQGWLPFISETGQGSFDESALSVVLFGLFIVVFLVFEPFGLYGLWLRLRNYWKGWPFSY
jgi:branched-chain amino acid transport system permease protein